MAQPMRKHEERNFPPGRPRRRGDAALDRLLAVADRSPDDAERVAAMLTAVARTAERPRPHAQLPDKELAVWSTVGAATSNRAAHHNDENLAQAFAELVADSVIGDTAMAKILSVDRSRISQRLADHSLYAYATGDDRCFPRWQLAGGKVVGGLKPVLISLDPRLHPLVVHTWFTTPNIDLEVDEHPVSPAAWLATGGSPTVAAALAADL